MNATEITDVLESGTKQVAERLRSAVSERTLVEPVRHMVIDQTEATAKRVQQMNIDHWIGNGRRVIGAKVGITSRVAQQQFGISAPASGSLFADMLATDGAMVDFELVPQLRVEAEIAFVLKADLDHPSPTIVDVISAIDYGLPAIELVSSRIRDWDIEIFDFVADNAAASVFVLGETPFDIRSCDVRTLGSVMTINGSRSFGSGGAYLGSPLQSLLWLARERWVDGQPLRRGETVMTGALGPIVPASRGIFIDVRIGSLPPVSVEVS